MSGKRRFPLLFLLPPLLALGIGALFLIGLIRGEDELPSTRQGGPAPAIMVERLGDKPLLERALLDAPGVKVVNFFASWCAPCRAEHPNIARLARTVPVYGVNYKDKPDNALGFLAELGDPYAAIGADANGRTAIEWGVYGIPETFIIDGNGTVVLRFAGPITSRVLEGTILPAIEAAK